MNEDYGLFSFLTEECVDDRAQWFVSSMIRRKVQMMKGLHIGT